MHPSSSDGLVGLSWTLIVSGRLDESFDFLVKACELEEAMSEFINLGHFYLCSGDKKEAIECYFKGVKLERKELNFWSAMEDDFQYLTQYGVTRVQYDEVLEEIKKLESIDKK